MDLFCPVCGYENLPGEELCENCGSDIADLGTTEHPTTEDSFEKDILSENALSLNLVEARRVPESTTVGESIRILDSEKIGAILIIDDSDSITGIFTAMDVLKKVTNTTPFPLEEPVRKFMTPDPQTLNAESRIVDALHLINVGGFGNIPINYDEKNPSLLGVKEFLDYVMTKHPELNKMQMSGENKLD